MGRLSLKEGRRGVNRRGDEERWMGSGMEGSGVGGCGNGRRKRSDVLRNASVDVTS